MTKTTQPTFSFMEDFFKNTNEYFSNLPKTPDEAKSVFEKVQKIFKTEYENSQTMWKTYQKASTGDATINEIASANKHATELLKNTAFMSLLAVPGTVFILPLLIAKAKEYNIDLVPKSVSAEFDI